MTTLCKRVLGGLWLVALTIPASAHFGNARPVVRAPAPTGLAAAATPLLADATGAQMRVGLRLVAAPAPAPALPEPASLPYPASPDAVLCHSDDHGYHECLTPFAGPARLSREVSTTRCVEDSNWGWRNGAVWVDRGCGAVFVRGGG